MKAAAAALIVLTLFAAVALREVADAGRNYSVLLRISERAFNANPLLRERTAVRERLVLSPGGYDAQYAYFAVFDPLLTRYAHAPNNYVLMMDIAPYRYGRIGHVWLTRLVAGDGWRGYPATMVWIVLLGCAAAALGLSAVARAQGRSSWWGLAIAAVPGYWQSVQLTLPEPIAAAAVLAAVACWQRQWWWGTATAGALALLTRETSMVAVAGLAAATFASGRRRIAVLLLAGALTPLVLWRWHVGTVLFPAFGVDAFVFNPGTFDWPGAGMVAAGRRIMAGTYHPAAAEIARAAVAFSVLLTATVIAAGQAWRRRRDAVCAIAVCYGVLALCLSGSTVWNHAGNAQRTSSEVFLWMLVAAVTWPPAGAGWRRAGVLWLAACAAYVLFGAHDASHIRAALPGL